MLLAHSKPDFVQFRRKKRSYGELVRAGAARPFESTPLYLPSGTFWHPSSLPCPCPFPRLQSSSKARIRNWLEILQLCGRIPQYVLLYVLYMHPPRSACHGGQPDRLIVWGYRREELCTGNCCSDCCTSTYPTPRFAVAFAPNTFVSSAVLPTHHTGAEGRFCGSDEELACRFFLYLPSH